MRWDLDGNGVAATGGYDSNNDGDYTDTGEYTYAAKYAEAFRNPEDNMGCNESAITISSQNTGNPACSGYELAANLDFDTDNDGRNGYNGRYLLERRRRLAADSPHLYLEQQQQPSLQHDVRGQQLRHIQPVHQPARGANRQRHQSGPFHI